MKRDMVTFAYPVELFMLKYSFADLLAEDVGQHARE